MNITLEDLLQRLNELAMLRGAQSPVVIRTSDGKELSIDGATSDTKSGSAIIVIKTL
jgi:hypothetical protein